MNFYFLSEWWDRLEENLNGKVRLNKNKIIIWNT